MMQSCIKLLIRRVCLRRGLFSTLAFLLIIAFFSILYFTSQDEEVLSVDDRGVRTIKVPSQQKPESDQVNLSLTSALPQHPNPNSNPPRQIHLSIPSPQGQLHIFPSDTQECSFSNAQPEHGHFNIQMSAVMEALPFDNPSGGEWKQGFKLSYSMDSFSDEPLQVFIVPHSHNDPGWLKTFTEYYRRQTRNILSLMTDALSQDSKKKFIWAEISYLDLWWNEQTDAKKEQFKRLVSNGQLEIVTGGWVMNDEANTHYFAMLDQLIEGHLWLQANIPGTIPQASWANDPFGYSPTMAYLLKGCGLDSMLIQRAHYSVKKHLARNKDLEFLWVQEWDRSYDSGIFCHLMPFYSYDIPHTCGPNPKICCQFDFHRLPGGKVSCPWKVRPKAISNTNVEESAKVLADQYRKKSTLYKTKVLLVPLGDDFRWDTMKEIRNQFENYFKLIDYMNSHPEMKIKVQFGTLSDYFKAVRSSRKPSKLNSIIPENFPTFTGDFFTYSDRDDHYWSGYFTSRPFHKHMDRVLETNLRTAEIFFSLSVARDFSLNSRINAPELLTEARRNLGLFQHHDGITGTAKDMVVRDYATRMLSAIEKSKTVTHAALKALLTGEESQRSGASTMAFNLEETYPAGNEMPSHRLVDIKRRGDQVVSFLNSLAHERIQLVSVLVDSPDVEVRDSSNVPVPSQLNPVFNKYSEYQLVFMATLPPLGVAHYFVRVGGDQATKATKAVIQYINHKPSLQLSGIFETVQFPSNDFKLSTNVNISAKFSGKTGLLKAVAMGSNEVALDLEFVQYGARPGKERSGAYLFLPDSEATSILSSKEKRKVTVVVGPLLQEVISDLQIIQHSVQLSNSPGLDGHYLSINNIVDISSHSNKEFAMRFRSSIDNKGQTFYTDLNGFQFVKRKTYQKIPLQGNFYPMPTAAVLQDKNNRMTLFSGQPLGVASLKKGWLEVVLDRRLMQDDHRGLGQGVKDNVRTFESFRLLIERRLSDASSTASLIYPSLVAQHTLDSLLHPPSAFISQAPSFIPPPYSFMQKELPCDMFLFNLRGIFRSKERMTESALIIHRRGMECGYNTGPLRCNLSSGEVKLGDIFKDVSISDATETSLSLLKDNTRLVLTSELLSHIDPMQMKTYRVAW